jgi:hypothetical protein
VQTPAFFLAEDGAIDPEREWDAQREAFLHPDSHSTAAQPAQCRFPARFAFMKDQLGWTDLDVPTLPCPEFEAFRSKLDARSLSVVFASHYLANPASAFGHTMLYLGSAATIESRLADYSVGFEADTKGLSPLGYIPRGLTGGLVAAFRVSPFHERVRKYERQELRDLWMFPLQVNQHEVDQLVRHLWELKDVSYRYGFFGGNCAQKILALVHAVVPRAHLLPYHRAAILPSEVVRRLVMSIGLAGTPVIRPSLLGRYSRQVDALPAADQLLLEQMIASRTVPAEVSPAVLSTAILWSEINLPHRTFRRASETGEHRDLQWKRRLLNALTAQSRSDRSLAASAVTRSSAMPATQSGAWQQLSDLSLLEAHAPSRLTVRGGHRAQAGAALGVGMRWLLHEPLDPGAGYPELSSLETLRIEAGVTAKDAGFIDEMTALRVEKFAAASRLQSPIGWKLEIGARRLPGEGGAPLHAGAEAAVGLGAAILRTRSMIAAYVRLGVRPGAIVSSDRATFAPAALASGGLLLRLPAGMRAKVQAEYAVMARALSTLDRGATVAATARKSLTTDLDLELLASWQQAGISASLGLIVFH